MSRAAMFAGAALASTACGGNKKPPAETVDNHHETVTADAAVAEPQPEEKTPPDPEPVPHNVKMPYGAPPMRRRVV